LFVVYWSSFLLWFDRTGGYIARWVYNCKI
jgi:hypothetical protein